MLSSSDVTVIVVTYNSSHCLAGLALTLSALPNVIIVDNASDDDTVEAAARVLPNAKIVCNPRNLGFGAANNVALCNAKTSYALLLNPDCVPECGFLDNLLRVANDYPDAAICAPHLLRNGNRIELSYRWPSTHWISKAPIAEGPCCVGFVCGAVMLLKLDVIREVGFFDEDFFLYYEDEDLCQRLFTLHKQIILAPDITVKHISRGSVRGASPLRAEYLRGYHHVQSKLIFACKHVNQAYAVRLRWLVFLLALASVIPRLLLPQPRYLARLIGRIRGLLDYRFQL